MVRIEIVDIWDPKQSIVRSAFSTRKDAQTGPGGAAHSGPFVSRLEGSLRLNGLGFERIINRLPATCQAGEVFPFLRSHLENF